MLIFAWCTTKSDGWTDGDFAIDEVMKKCKDVGITDCGGLLYDGYWSPDGLVKPALP